MQQLKLKWQNLELETKILILSLLSTLTHFAVTVFFLCIVFIMLIFKKRLGLLNKSHKYFKWSISLLVFNLGVSLFRNNLLGFTFTIFIILIYMDACYFKTIITKELIDDIIDLYTRCSLLVFLYVIIGMFFNRYVITFNIVNYSRILYLNENYAATVYSFVIICALYLFNKHKKYLYLLIAICNLYLIYQADSRGALIGVIIGAITYILITNIKRVIQYRYWIFMALVILIVYIILSIFEVVPSIKLGFVYKYMTYRIGIWNTAYLAFLEHPIIGYGQYSHLTYCSVYGTMCIIHAHNIYLELLVSFGIVGIIMLGYLLWKKVKNFKHLFYENKKLFGLVISILVVTAFHGLVDYQIFWLQPGYLFLVLMFIPDIFNKKQHD